LLYLSRKKFVIQMFSLYFFLTCFILFVGRSNVESLLDEEDTESDTPISNRMVTQDDECEH
jgi:hypothetical protein